MMKKLFALLLSAMLLMSMLQPALAATSDQSQTHKSHTWGEWVVRITPTCSKPGKREHVCQVCYKSDFEMIPTTAHSFGSWTVNKSAGCTHDGKRTGTCKVCGKSVTEVIPAIGHSYAVDTNLEASCTRTGEDLLTCYHCGYQFTKTTPARGHQFGGWIVKQEATEGEYGIEERVCSVCRYPEERTFALGEARPVEPEVTPVPELPTDEVIPGSTAEPAPQFPDFEGQLYLEDRSELTSAEVESGSVLMLPVRLYNVGQTRLHIADYSTGVKGERANGATPEDNEGLKLMFPGDTVDVLMFLVVSDADMQSGKIQRSITFQSYEIESNGHFGKKVFSRTLELELPITVNGAPVLSPVEPDPTAEPEAEITPDPTAEPVVEITPEPTAEPVVEITTAPIAEPVINVTPVPVSEVPAQPSLYCCMPEIMLGVTKISEAKPVYALGDKIVYSYTVANISEEDLTQVCIARSNDKSDPSQGVTVIAEGIDLPAYGGTYSGTYTLTLSETDLLQSDRICSVFTAAGVCAHGNQVRFTTPVAFEHPVGELPQIATMLPPDTNYSSVSVEKTVLNKPVQAQGYQLGESILYQIRVTNNSQFAIYDIDVTDPLKGQGSDALVGNIPVLLPGASVDLTFTYSVTQLNVLNGCVTNIATARWLDPSTFEDIFSYSNYVFLPTIIAAEPALAVTKIVTGDDAFYMPGDNVLFNIAVANNTQATFYDVNVFDAMAPSANRQVQHFASIEPGEVREVPFSYTVTEADAYTMSVVNVGYVTSTDGDGWSQQQITGATQVVVGDPENQPVTVVKVETSKPANGAWYALDEMIVYDIVVTNNTEWEISDVKVYDSLNATMDEIDAADVIPAGESRTFAFTYTVNENDVEAGYVENIASITYIFKREPGIAESEPVVSPTGREPSVTLDRDPGTIRTPIDGDCCRPVLEARAETVLEYNQHYCPDHAATWHMASTVEPAEAIVLWTADVNLLYDAAYAAATTSSARHAVLNDKALFYAQVSALQEAGASDETVVMLLMNQCTELCYVLHCAPEARPDSYYANATALSDAQVSTECAIVPLTENDTDALRSETLCPAHAAADLAVTTLIVPAATVTDRAAAWQAAQVIWTTELDRLCTTPESMAARGLFLNYITAHKAFLNRLYPANPDIVHEVLTRTIMQRVELLCE